MREFQHDFVPPIIRELSSQRWIDILARCDASLQRRFHTIFEDNNALKRQLDTVLASSIYLYESFRKTPQILEELIDSGCLERSSSTLDYQRTLDRLLVEFNVESEAGFSAVLRAFRRREMCRLIWRDFNRAGSMQETTAEVSALADVAIEASLDFLYQQMSVDLGVPRDDDGNQQQLVVLAMGKLGAYELNLSSDVDLIFCFPDSGTTDSNSLALSNKEFFARLGKKLIAVLDRVSEDGFVFRVDMRLRPFGQSGPLVPSFESMERYYLEQGRDWERFALIKSRVCAGDKHQGARLLKALTPFVFRRYADYSAIGSLRDMKRLIEKEVRRRFLDDDIKLGAGGIREIEFIVQCVQLIHGGRDLALQTRGLLPALEVIAENKYLPQTVVDDLEQAYVFLRNIEHALQGYRDQQTQKLPQDELQQQLLAVIMGHNSWSLLDEELRAVRAKVNHHFRAFISESEAADTGTAFLSPDLSITCAWQSLRSGADLDDVIKALQLDGFHAKAFVEQLVSFVGRHDLAEMDQIGLARLDAFMPLLLVRVQFEDEPCQCLARVLVIVEAVLRRSVYLVMLTESPFLLEQMVVLSGFSEWISQLLARNPILLEELGESPTAQRLPDRGALHSELLQQLNRLPEDDHEAHLSTLAYFKLGHQLRIAAGEVTGRLTLMMASNYLTYVAEVVLEQALALAWRDLVSKYGAPVLASGRESDGNFIIVAYGKLGGLELGYNSDLDLVFIHDLDADGETTGPRSVTNQQFYIRLGQRIIHILTTRTYLDPMYEIDMRLRPSGNSGLLVSSMVAYQKYQHESAWNWEHQAMVRARAVAGDSILMRHYEDFRIDVLAQLRDSKELASAVVGMRLKMRSHNEKGDSLGNKEASFDLKHGVGGIVDIEFMVQYAVLNWSHVHFGLSQYTDNIRILDRMAALELISAEQAEQVAKAYKRFRRNLHRLNLQGLPGKVPGGDFKSERRSVIQLWDFLFAG